MPIKSADIFLESEGQQLDFSKGVVDVVDVFNSAVTPTVNNLLRDTGAEEDPILKSIRGSAQRAKDNKQQLGFDTGVSNNFGFEGEKPVGQPNFNTNSKPSSRPTNKQSGDFDPASFTFNKEARKDKNGRLSVFTPPSGDGGGSFEVAGITAKFQPKEAGKLRSLIQQGKHGEAEKFAKDFFRKRAEPFVKHASQRGLQLQLADTVHHRGEGGLRKILQRATGSSSKNYSTLIKQLDNDPEALAKFNKSRVDHELQEVDRGRASRKKFRKGLLNRFASANEAAISANT